MQHASFVAENLQPSSTLQINLPGYRVIKVRGLGLQQVLSDRKKLYCGRIYSLKEFNRIVAAYKALNRQDKRAIARIHLARYLSPWFGVVVTPLYTRVTFEEARRNIKPFMQSLLYALSCCHAEHIVHRNVNFNSVMRVTTDEQNKGAFPFVLTNFKYAVCISSKAFRRPKGWMRYRAPEAVGNSVPKEARTAVDVWSAGVMFLELVCQDARTFNTILTEVQLLNQRHWFTYSDPELSKDAILRTSDEEIEEICQREIEDKDAGDLLMGLLRVDYRQRIRARIAWNHPYFRN